MSFFSKIKPAAHLPYIIGGIILALALAFVFGFFVMLLWNWLMPEIFGLKQIDYWQAWGLFVLAHILFKSGPHHKHGHNGEHHKNWKTRFQEHVKTAMEAEKVPMGKEEEKGAAPKSRKSKD